MSVKVLKMSFPISPEVDNDALATIAAAYRRRGRSVVLPGCPRTAKASKHLWRAYMKRQ
jgi:hypothetical protein